MYKGLIISKEYTHVDTLVVMFNPLLGQVGDGFKDGLENIRKSRSKGVSCEGVRGWGRD